MKMLASLAAVTLAVLVAAAPARAETATWNVDSTHSSVMFRIKHLNTAYVYGMFEQTTGTVTLDPDNLAATEFDITVPVESIHTGNEKRDNHLRSGDFFDEENHPEIRFQSTGVESVEDNVMKVNGELTLHGQTKPITIHVTLTGTGENPMDGSTRAGLETSFTIKRGDFGMDWGLDNNMLSDEVNLMVALETVKQE